MTPITVAGKGTGFEYLTLEVWTLNKTLHPLVYTVVHLNAPVSTQVAALTLDLCIVHRVSASRV